MPLRIKLLLPKTVMLFAAVMAKPLEVLEIPIRPRVVLPAVVTLPKDRPTPEFELPNRLRAPLPVWLITKPPTLVETMVPFSVWVRSPKARPDPVLELEAIVILPLPVWVMLPPVRLRPEVVLLVPLRIKLPPKTVMLFAAVMAKPLEVLEIPIRPRVVLPAVVTLPKDRPTPEFELPNRLRAPLPVWLITKPPTLVETMVPFSVWVRSPKARPDPVLELEAIVILPLPVWVMLPPVRLRPEVVLLVPIMEKLPLLWVMLPPLW